MVEMALVLPVLLLLAISLAGPAITRLGSLWGGSSTAVVIVLDNSYSMSQTDGVSSRFDKAKNAAEGPKGRPEPKFVSVTKEGKVYFESDEVTLDQLQEQMKLTNAQGIKIMMKADKETEYRFIRPVLDRASKAKMKGIALAAEQLKVK